MSNVCRRVVVLSGGSDGCGRGLHGLARVAGRTCVVPSRTFRRPAGSTVGARAARLHDRRGSAGAQGERRQDRREDDRAVGRRPCHSTRPMRSPGRVSEYLVRRVHAALSAASPPWLREKAGESLRTRRRRAAKTARNLGPRNAADEASEPKNLASLASLAALPSLESLRAGPGPQAAPRFAATTSSHVRSSISATFSRNGTATVPSTPMIRCDA
jgi:hypothetical protein